MDFTDRTFIDEKVVLDGNSFERCSFIRCDLIYKGGELTMKNCSLQSTRYFFDGAALETIRFLADLYHSGAAVAVEEIFEAIRKNVNPSRLPPDSDSIH